jgi:hypothetical protein
VLTADRDLPGFLPALDAATVGRLLAAEVIPPHMKLGDLRVERFTYDPGESAIILYIAELDDPRAGLRQRTWLTATIYRNAKGQNLARSISESGSLLRGPEELPVAGYSSELGALIQIFPHDWRIPALKEYQSGSSPALHAFLRGQVDSDGPCALSVEISPVRYRPGKMATLRVSLYERPATGEGSRKTFYVKLRAEPDSLGMYDRLRILSESGRKRGFRIVLPVAYLEADRAAVFEAAPGTLFAHLICANQPIEGPARSIGRDVAAFHMSDASVLPRENGQRFYAKARRSVRLIEWACPALAATAKRLLSHLEDLPSPPAVRPTHYNMKPEHIFLDSDGVIHLIDTESARADDPAIDIGRLLARLDALEYHAGVPQDRIAEAKRAFEEGYFEAAASAWRDRIGAARAYGGLQEARHCIRHQLPGWEARVALELERALNSLEHADRRCVP